MDIFEIFKSALDVQSSDIHLTVGKPPMIRLKGDLEPLSQFAKLSPQESKRIIYSILSEEQKKRFEQNLELDCSINAENLSRFRVNVFLQKYGVEAVFRVIPTKIPIPEEIGLSKDVVKLTDLPRGLILVTGPTGSGKSTTLACLIDIINQNYKRHIMTLEDPIEFVYESKNSIVRQREVGTHTKSFATALKYILRQDPDVILVGEMRDLETIAVALTVSETGHLVFATLHTQDAPQTVDRIIDIFPVNQQQQIRVQLSTTLRSVISQILLPRKDGNGRIAAREVMMVTPAVANIIREGKTHQLYSAIETGAKFGMISLDKALIEMVRRRKIDLNEALSKAQNPKFVRSSI